MNAMDLSTFLMRERTRLQAKAAEQAAMFISICEVAQKYKTSLRTLGRMQAAGKLPSRTRLRKKKKYRRDDIERLFQPILGETMP